MESKIKETLFIAEALMMDMFNLNIHQVFAHLLGTGSKAVVYIHPHDSTRVLKFTTDVSVIELKQRQMLFENQSDYCFPVLYQLVEQCEGIWLIEEEQLDEYVTEDSVYFNLIKNWVFSPTFDRIREDLNNCQELNIHKKHRLVETISFLEGLQDEVSFKLDFCVYNFRLKNDQLILLDPIIEG